VGSDRKPVSKAAVRRRMAELVAEANEIVELAPEFVQLIQNYQSTTVDPVLVNQLRPVLRDLMSRSKITTRGRFENTLTALCRYLAWRLEQGLSPDREHSMTYLAIDAFYAQVVDDYEPRTLNDYRSRLRILASEAYPGAHNPTTAHVEGYRAIRQGYTLEEEAVIRRMATRQRSSIRRRQACAIVGLAGGGGIDARDFRVLESAHVDDQGDNGIIVTVPGSRPRQTVIRREYEELVRIGLEDVKPNAKIIGNSATLKNRVGSITVELDTIGGPEIDVARLRTTWLTWLITQPIPLALVMQVSGLRSGRTLTDLLAYAQSSDTDLTSLKGEQA